MNALLAFIRLLRPLNLLIVVFTMYTIRWGVLQAISARFGFASAFELNEWQFGLTVLVVVLIAAAGNMINDYFDLKVDRVNKPNRIIVGRLVKRRVVMLMHHTFNLAAVGCTLMVALRFDRVNLVWVPIVLATVLWSYSLWFKRQIWIGNFVVSALVGIVPIWAGIFEIPAMELSIIQAGGRGHEFAFESWRWIIGFAGFAFWTTLIRELQKDVEDQKGDAQAGYKTIPIVWGQTGAKNYLHALFTVLFIALALTIFEVRKQLIESDTATLFTWMALAGIGLPAGWSWYQTATAKTPAHYGKASGWSKLTMAMGILIGTLMPLWY
jgi:4-hydroxybenzoate polyprenyltransferase